MLEGLEISIIQLSKVDYIKNRLDAEYYQKYFLLVESHINHIGQTNLCQIGAKLDCSAFYPSITDFYNFNGEGVPFLRVNEISNGLVKITENTAFIPQYILDNNTSTIAIGYPGDMIIAKGGNTLAKVGLITTQYEKYALSRDIILVRTNKLQSYNKHFLWLFMHSNIGQAFLWRTASQTGQPHLTLPSINDISLPRYSCQFEKITEELYKKSVSLYHKSKEYYAQAETLLLQEIGLQDFEPSKEPVNIKSFKDSFGATGRLDAEYYQRKYEQIIEKIVTQKHDALNNLVEISKSIEPGSDNYSEEGGLPFYRVSDFNKLGLGKPDKKLTDSFIAENKELIKKLKPKQGTILFSKDGSVGTAYYLRNDLDGITSGAILHLKVRNSQEIIPEYLTLALNSKLVQMQAERDAGGSIILHWRKEEIEQVVVPIIDFNKQEQIAGLVEESFKLKAESERLLDVAKRAVEMAIETDEETAMQWIADTANQ